ncbi:MAG: toprim domain-containing protein [Rhodospirillales bacterium]|nr:toprim domain-containing protein [Rhodospirillales bacterium]
MNASDTAAALAAHAEHVCRKYLPHGRRRGRYWCAGDVRGAPGRSLFVRLEPPGPVGKWSDPAEQLHGDLLDLIRLATGARSLREALAEARRFLAEPLPPSTSHPDTYDRTEAARNLWNRCQPIDGSHAEKYLHARGIRRCRFPALRFHSSLPYRPDSGGWRRYPALVAAVVGADGEVAGVHRTWLDPKRPAKANVDAPRRGLGRIHGFAVRFGETAAASTLLVGEGIETVLSLVTVLPDGALQAITPSGTFAAAALSAGGLGTFVPPPVVSRLVIAQDRDDEGERASRRLQLRCTRLGIASTILLPVGNDFNDDLQAFGAAPLATRLAPLVPNCPTGNRSSLAAHS